MHDEIASQQLMTQLPTKVKYRKPGRPMKPGKYLYDPGSQTFGYFLGLCNHCNARVIKPKHELPQLVYKVNKQNKTWKVRMLRYIERKLTT